jgi:hypothetical protein
MAVSDRLALVLLVAFTLAITGAGVLWESWVPFTALLFPMFLGSLLLGPRALPWFVVFVCGCVCVLLVVAQESISQRSVTRVAVTFAIALLIMGTSFRRSRLGVSGPRGESMFVDLRDRIARQGAVPGLPKQWLAESVARAAGGTSFAGDFVVAARTNDGYLELVVVDVSGKGVEAGTRSLFLSGALNGIVSALPGKAFLPAANEYLLRQGWDEGFATAIHLHLHLETGDFELRKAGHPPAVWLHAGSGRWTVLSSDGPALGLLPDVEFETLFGTLQPGDGLMMFTDGLVESSARDMSDGIDMLAGHGGRLVVDGFEGGAERVVRAMHEPGDDVALVVVHRRP